jgi:hypothetical protein
MDQMPGRFPPPPEQGSPYGIPREGYFPLDLNRVFELTFSLFRFKSRAFLGAALIVMIPVSILLALTSIVTAGAMTDWLTEVQQVAFGRPVDMSRFPVAATTAGVLVGVVTGIGTLIAQAAMTHLALATYGSQNLDTGTAVRHALRRLGTIAGVYLVTFLVTVAVVIVGVLAATLLLSTAAVGGRIGPGLGVFLGLIVFVATFAVLIFVAVRWTLAVPALVTEGGGARAALGRSWRLASGSSWRVLAYLIVFGLIFGLIQILLTFVLTLIVNPSSLTLQGAVSQAFDPVRSAIIQFGSGLIGALLMPFPAIGMTLLYLDLRWRRGEPVPQPGEGVPAAPAVSPPQP